MIGRRACRNCGLACLALLSWGEARAQVLTPPELSSPTDGATGQPTVVSLSWKPVLDAGAYNVELSTERGFTSPLVDDTTGGTSDRVGPLPENTTCYWRVRSLTLLGASRWSAIWSLHTMQSPPAAPVLSAPADGATGQPVSLTLAWSPSAGATSYRLQVASNASFAQPAFDDSTVTTTSYALSGLRTSTLYYWRVNAKNSGGTSDWPKPSAFTTGPGFSPEAPSLSSPPNGATSEPATVTLQWRAVPGAGAYELQISATADFSSKAYDDATLSDTMQTAGPLGENSRYYWRVRTSSPGPPGQWSSVWSFVTAPSLQSSSTYNLSHTIPFPSYPSPSEYKPADYRIAGLPGAGDADVAAMLGGVQNRDWQAYRDNGAATNGLIQYDGSADFRFGQGRAFWIVRRGPWVVSGTVPAPSLNAAREAEIPLHAGWNLITNPFTWPVSWTRIQTADSLTDPLYGFSGSFAVAGRLEPYAGYYFFNSRNIRALRIPSDSAPPPAVPANAFLPAAWKVNIAAASGGASDSLLWLGVLGEPDAAKGGPRFHKPHAVGPSIHLSFDRPEWDAAYRSFATDLRAAIDRIEEWRFTVTGAAGAEVQLTFSGIDDVPARFRIFLIDERSGASVDLRERPAYSFTPADARTELSVAVGTGEAMHDRLTPASAPREFALGQNFPNPFNPSTIIPVDLASVAHVEIRIYNELGEEVRRLYSGVLGKGRHFIPWHGDNDNGIPAAGGIYICRLTSAGGRTLARKMFLIR